MKFSRRGALAVAGRAHRRLGVPRDVALYIAFACRKLKLPYALGYALVSQESGFRHIFGHDAGGLFPGLPVTRARYRALREHLKATHGPGANGAGLTQPTYWTYIVQNPGLWKKRANVYWGLGILAGLIAKYGEHTGIGAYNGGEANPVDSYADSVEAKARDIRPRLSKKG